jgi:hypothetical protein
MVSHRFVRTKLVRTPTTIGRNRRRFDGVGLCVGSRRPREEGGDIPERETNSSQDDKKDRKRGLQKKRMLCSGLEGIQKLVPGLAYGVPAKRDRIGKWR